MHQVISLMILIRNNTESNGKFPTSLMCGVLQVLLVSSSRHPDKWIVPGGGMEPEEEPNVAAAREVCEEVGAFNCFYNIVYWPTLIDIVF